MSKHVYTHSQGEPSRKVKVKFTQLCLTLRNPMDYTVHGILQARILDWVAFPFSDLLNPGIEPSSPTLKADSLPAKPHGKPKNTGVGSLSLLQQIFPTQELNWGLLHCRQILYQLSCKRALKKVNQIRFTNCACACVFICVCLCVCVRS